VRTSSTTTLRQPATSAKGVRNAGHAKRALAPASYPQARHRVVAPSLKVADAAAASVFSAASGIEPQSMKDRRAATS